MLKNKRILLIIVLAVALFLIPSICSAATINATETTQTSTGKTVKWSYELSGDLIVNLKCTNTSEISGTVTIPSTIDGYTVTTLADDGSYFSGAFYNCAGLTGITIPNTVTTIGDGAFRQCVGLKTVTIPDSVTEIGRFAFYKNTGLTSITLSGNLASIGAGAFSGCVGLKTITIPNSVTTIGDSAFESCTGLKSLVIPDTVTAVGEDAFCNCSGLTSLTLSQNLTSIQGRAFYGCTGLTSVVIPDSVTTIEGPYGSTYGAFGECKNLEKVLIPNSVASIGIGAFGDCSKLTIYGNDGQASKQYAEDNDINFDYIANWDKAAVGDDITPPELKSLTTNRGSFDYDSGTRYYMIPVGASISIKASFEEILYGETAPTLTIRCGNGEKIEVNNGVISGSTIVYTYTIKEQDKGLITAVSLTGGDIKDESGNVLKETTCPELKDDLWGRYMYANGSGLSAGNNGNDENQSTVTLSSISIKTAPTKVSYKVGEAFDKTGMVVIATYSDGTTKEITNYTISPSTALKTSDTKVVITYTENGVTKTVEQKITVTAKTTNSDDSNTNKDNNSKDDTIKDTTTKNDSKLPQTGVAVLSLALVTLIVVAVISKVKYGKYKDI